MNRIPRRPSAIVAGVALGVLIIAPLAAQGGKLRHTCPPCLAITNSMIRADIAPNGTWVLGTTGGDPDAASDDDKSLLYGFVPGSGSQIGSSFSTVRIEGPRGITDAIHTDPAPQAQAGNRATTAWRWDNPYRVAVTQTLQVRANPFSGRMDMVGIQYAMENRDSVALNVGVRALLDIQIGIEDGAPYFIPGLGTVATERDFRGADVPPIGSRSNPWSTIRSGCAAPACCEPPTSRRPTASSSRIGGACSGRAGTTPSIRRR